MDAFENLLTNGLSAAALGQLAVFIVALYAAYETRRAIRKAAALRRIEHAGYVRPGDQLVVDGNQATSKWQVQSVAWDGVFLQNVDHPELQRREPPEHFLAKPLVFERAQRHTDRKARHRGNGGQGG